MGVYGIGLFFMRNFGNFDFNVRYCVIIRPCGMRYFIILADGIRGNMIVLGMAVSLRTADVFPVVASLPPQRPEIRLRVAGYIAVRFFAFSFRYNT